MVFKPHFKISEADCGDDSLEATLLRSYITLEIEEPWAGCTRTGFGRRCTMTIHNISDARALAAWLNEAANIAEANTYLDDEPGGDFKSYIAHISDPDEEAA